MNAPRPDDLEDAYTGALPARGPAYDPTAARTGMEFADIADEQDTADHTAEVTGALEAGIASKYINLADFEIATELGRGGMGVVHLARHRRTGRWFAIKTLLAEKASEPAFKARFHRESRVLQAIEHPHVVKLHGITAPHTAAAIVLQYYPGADGSTRPDWKPEWPNPPQNLHQYCKAHGALPIPRVLEIGVKIAGALHVAHGREVVHRDVTPQNIILDAHGEPVLIDFGIARQKHAGDLHVTTALDNFGTVFYTAPEVAEDPTAACPASDQYSLAITVYAAATGEVPRGLTPEKIPARLYRVLKKATEKDPAARYASAAAFAEALQALQAGPLDDAPAFEPHTIICPSCSNSNADTEKLCSRCGVGLWAPCLKCQASMPVTRAACPHCGGVQKALADEQVRQAEKLLGEAEKLEREQWFAECLAKLKPLANHTGAHLAEPQRRVREAVERIEVLLQARRQDEQNIIQKLWPSHAVGNYAESVPEPQNWPKRLWTPRLTRLVEDRQRALAAVPESVQMLLQMMGRHEAVTVPVAADVAMKQSGLPKVLGDYLETIPHHGLDDIVETLKPTRASEHYSFLAVVTCLHETRATARKSRPHTGGDLPPRMLSPDAVDVWACDLEVPNAMADATQTTTLRATEDVVACESCRKMGLVACGNCRGKKDVVCEPCTGTAEVPCSACRGTGREQFERSVRKFETCGTCRGSGSHNGRRCANCEATGKASVNEVERYTEPCRACHEKGKVSCKNCHASGRVDCPTCKAKGKVTCRTCDGHALLVDYVDIIQSFTVGRSSSARPRQSSLPAPLAARVADDHYRRVDSVTLPPGVVLRGDAVRERRGEFGERLAAVLDALPAKLENNARLSRQNIEFLRVVGHEVHYAYRGKQYGCWILGGSGDLHLTQSPVTDELVRMVNGAVKRARSDPREAAVTIREVRAMAVADAPCREALQTVRPKIPRQIWDRSESVWSTEKRDILYGGYGLAGLAVILLIAGAIVGLKFLLIVGVIAALVGAALIAFGYNQD